VIRASYDFEATGQRAQTDLVLRADGLPEKRIFFEFVGPAAPRHRPGAEFAILAALPMAMRLGQPIHASGTADASFLASIEELQEVWHRWRPDLFRPVPLSVDAEAKPARREGRRAIAAFSGGLDSIFALHAHRRKLLGRRSLDVEGAFLVQGFDLPLDAGERFDRARRSAAAILDHYEVPLTTFMIGLAAIFHQFSDAFDQGVVAADMPYEGEILGWGNNSITNPMLGSLHFPIRSTGGGWSRSEKAGLLGMEPAVLANLRICTNSPTGENCGICEKCIRTKLNFLVNGIDDVPALGGPVTAEALGKVRITNGAQANLWREILEHGSWDRIPEIRGQIEAMIRAGVRPDAQPARRRPRVRLRLWWKYRRA